MGWRLRPSPDIHRDAVGTEEVEDGNEPATDRPADPIATVATQGIEDSKQLQKEEQVLEVSEVKLETIEVGEVRCG